LELIGSKLGVGSIYKHGKDSIQLRVQSNKELEVIVSHFDSYPLITQKFADYLLFKQAFEMIKNKEHLTIEGLKKIVEIKVSLNLGLSDKIQKVFPDRGSQCLRSLVINPEIRDPN
jgi:LAGLIDADG endonuclease